MSEIKTRKPQQKRSKEQVQKIRNAAFKLFSDKGYYNTSSNQIAQAACVSIGTFYSYYSDKKDLFIELLHEYNQNVVDQLPDFFADKQIIVEELVHSLVYRVFDSHNLSPAFHREMIIMTQSDSEIKEIIDNYDSKMIKKIQTLLNSYAYHVSDVAEKAYLIFTTTESIVHSIKIFGCAVDEKVLLQEHINMLTNYILGFGIPEKNAKL